jgi:hypothetical protein
MEEWKCGRKGIRRKEGGLTCRRCCGRLRYCLVGLRAVCVDLVGSAEV